MDNKLEICYFAFSEQYGAKHAGFVHSFNIVTSLSKFLKVNSFFSCDKRLIVNNKNLKIYGVNFPNLRNLFRINPLNYFRSYFLVKSVVRKSDLMHERFHVNPIDLLFIRNKPYVLEINDPAMVLHDNFLYRFLINLKLKKCSCVITQTNTLKKILQKYTDKQIYVVPNGVNLDEFRLNKTDVRETYKIKDKEILVVFIGAFMQWHGVQDIVKLAKYFKNVKFMMVGDGSEFENVKKEAIGVDNLILTGSKEKDEIPKFLNAADIAIAPFNTKRFSKLEDYGFWWCPVKLFEYLGAGKPVVSYNYPEVRNIVKGAGLLAEPGNFEDLKDKLKQLIENSKLRKKLSANAVRIAKSYDWKYRAKETYEVYKKCLK